LGRGFAYVRAADGKTVTSAASISGGDNINIQFRDGVVPARAVQGNDLE
jgi:exonuclease VII large subunit